MSKHLFKVGPAKRAWSAGVLWNPHALWVGSHYSPYSFHRMYAARGVTP